MATVYLLRVFLVEVERDCWRVLFRGAFYRVAQGVENSAFIHGRLCFLIDYKVYVKFGAFSMCVSGVVGLIGDGSEFLHIRFV